LRQVSGKTTDFVDGTNSTQDLGAATRNNIWYVRQRSFNAVGNSNFEVDQRNAGNAIVAPTGNVYVQDRWQWGQASTVTGRVTLQQINPASGFGIAIPGVNYFVTSKVLSVKLTTGQAALATGDIIYLFQQIEGPRFREMAADVHSLSLLVNCDSAFHFTAFIKDQASGQSLVLPCSVPAATWTLIQLPGLPIWPSGGTFSVSPGAIGYQLGVCLGSGATFTAPAASVWQSGNYMAAAGADNFMDLALNTVFRIAVIQHEPGPNCSYLMDQDFGTNLEGCQRYFQKSYPYPTKIGTTGTAGASPGAAAITTYVASANPIGPIGFRKRMAKVPNMQTYNPISGAAGTVRDLNGATDRAVATYYNLGDAGFSGWTLSTLYTASTIYSGHWVADTGW
jgi:hypothetical protein